MIKLDIWKEDDHFRFKMYGDVSMERDQVTTTDDWKSLVHGVSAYLEYELKPAHLERRT